MLRQIFVLVITVLCAGCTITAGYMGENERKLALYQKHEFSCKLTYSEQEELGITETCTAIEHMTTSITGLLGFVESVTTEFVETNKSLSKEEQAVACSKDDKESVNRALLEQYAGQVALSISILAEAVDSCDASGNVFCHETFRELQESGFVEEIEARHSAWKGYFNENVVPICGKDFILLDEELKI